MKKSRLMREVEEQYHKPLEVLLPPLLEELGPSDTANELGIAKATLGYWILKLGWRLKRTILKPGEAVLVVKDINYKPPTPAPLPVATEILPQASSAPPQAPQAPPASFPEGAEQPTNSRYPTVLGYCWSCKGKQPFRPIREEPEDSGRRPVYYGPCGGCGRTINKIGSYNEPLVGIEELATGSSLGEGINTT